MKTKHSVMSKGSPKSLEEAILNGLNETLELEEHNQEAIKEVSEQIAHHVRDFIRNKIQVTYMKVKDEDTIKELDVFMERMGHFSK